MTMNFASVKKMEKSIEFPRTIQIPYNVQNGYKNILCIIWLQYNCRYRKLDKKASNNFIILTSFKLKRATMLWIAT